MTPEIVRSSRLLLGGMKAFALVALVLLNTCTSAGAVGGTVEIRELAKGGYAATERAGMLVAFDEETYARLWDSAVRNMERPRVDFATDAVVFIFAGERNSGGYSVVTRGATIEGETLLVDGEVQGPPRDAVVTQALTYPYAVIAVNTRDFKTARWAK